MLFLLRLALQPPKAMDMLIYLFVFEAAAEVGHAIDGYTVVVTKSTVPVGTGREIHRIISENTCFR